MPLSGVVSSGEAGLLEVGGGGALRLVEDFLKDDSVEDPRLRGAVFFGKQAEGQ